MTHVLSQRAETHAAAALHMCLHSNAIDAGKAFYS